MDSTSLVVAVLHLLPKMSRKMYTHENVSRGQQGTGVYLNGNIGALLSLLPKVCSTSVPIRTFTHECTMIAPRVHHDCTTSAPQVHEILFNQMNVFLAKFNLM